MNLPGLADRAYRLLLRAYPADFADTFGDEMRRVFRSAARDAASDGRLGRFLLHELADAPRGLFQVHRDRWKNRLESGIRALEQAASPGDLPPLPPDGSTSRGQAFLETGLFLITGLLLAWGTYAPPAGFDPGRLRDAYSLRPVVALLTLPVLLLGLVRGLPRWAYPAAGLYLVHQVLVTGPSLWVFLAANLVAGLLLAIAALSEARETLVLPAVLQRIVRSISADWTRASFALYGAAPLLILAAFDDVFTNDRTPYLAAAAAAMVLGAWVYARAGDERIRISALLAGTAAAVWSAWLDKSAFGVGLANWSAVPHGRPEDYAWLLRLWLGWSALLLLPGLPALAGRAFRARRRI